MNNKDKLLLQNGQVRSKIWVLKTVSDEDRTYRSIDMYDDDLTTQYVYDSNVANHKQLKENDVVIIVNKDRILGFARIKTIHSTYTQKTINYCPDPDCRSTNYEERKSKNPKYRCNRKHEFDVPLSKTVDVVRFIANYENSFIEVRNYISIAELRPYYVNNYNRNMSMQLIDYSFLENKFPEVQAAIYSGIQYYILPQQADSIEEDQSNSYLINDNNGRQFVLRQISVRRGHKKFRDNIRKRYGNKCMVTGCEVLDLLEAAYINTYKTIRDTDVGNGMLLRSDIHTLYDLDLIGIHPDTLTIHVHESIQRDGYQAFHLQPLKGCSMEVTPSKEALTKRWNKFVLRT